MKAYMTKEELWQEIYFQNKEILTQIRKKDKERCNELWETKIKGYFDDVKRILSHLVFEICSELELKASYVAMWTLQKKLNDNLILLERKWRKGESK